MHATRCGLRRAGVAGSIGLAGAGLLLLAGVAPAHDRFVAGQVGVDRVAVPSSEAGPLIARALADTTALGLRAGARSTATRVTNRFLASSYVEVTGLDAAGQPTSLARYGPDGRLRTAIALGWRAPGRPLSAGTAGERAREFAVTAGMAPVGPAREEATAEGGFSVTWPRTADGIPVPGDGIRVVLWADGTLHSIASQERQLAAAPSSRITRDDARRRAESLLATWLPPSARQAVRITAVENAWVAPSDMFSAARPDAPDRVLRLAWVVRLAANGPLAERWEQLEIHLDAGDGSLLGGDILR